MNIEQALTEAISKMSGRKNGAAIIGMAFLYLMRDQSWQVLALVAGISVSSILLQFVLDMYEVRTTGKDQPENGNGNAPAVAAFSVDAESTEPKTYSAELFRKEGEAPCSG